MTYIIYMTYVIYHYDIYDIYEKNNDKHTVSGNLTWYCYRKSNIARATYRLDSYLLADN